MGYNSAHEYNYYILPIKLRYIINKHLHRPTSDNETYQTASPDKLREDASNSEKSSRVTGCCSMPVRKTPICPVNRRNGQ